MDFGAKIPERSKVNDAWNRWRDMVRKMVSRWSK